MCHTRQIKLQIKLHDFVTNKISIFQICYYIRKKLYCVKNAIFQILHLVILEKH